MEKTENKKLETEVTSVAKEELKTDTTINTPSPEELVHRASSSFFANFKQLMNLLEAPKTSKYYLSRRSLNRVVAAVLSLPTDKIPVNLKSDAEKLAFGLGQRTINDRFIITQFHISNEAKIMKELQSLRKVQLEKLDVLKKEGKTEEELKKVQEEFKLELQSLEKTLRGEDEPELKEDVTV